MHICEFCVYVYERGRSGEGVEYYKYLSLLLKQKKNISVKWDNENWSVKSQ